MSSLTLVGEGFIFDERHEIVRIKWKTKADWGKAELLLNLIWEKVKKYWTLDINEAHVFPTLDAATEQLCKLPTTPD